MRFRCRRRQYELNAKGLQDRQDLADFGCLFAPFEFYDESQARACGQDERLFASRQALSGSRGSACLCLGYLIDASHRWALPYGNINPRYGQAEMFSAASVKKQ